MAYWAIKARYIVYPAALFLFLFFFRHHSALYPYFIYAAIIPFILNFIVDYIYRFDKSIYITGVLMAILDSAITAYIVFLTGGFRSPFFFMFLVQLLGVGLLNNAFFTLMFLFIDTLVYAAMADLNILLREGKFVFVNQNITGIITQLKPERIDYIVINIVLFTVIVLILAFINYRLNIIFAKLDSSRKKIDLLLTMANKFRNLQPLGNFLDETTKMIADTLGYKYNAIILLSKNKTVLHMNSHNPKTGEEKKTIEHANDLLGYDLKSMSVPMSSENNIVVRAVKEMNTLITNDPWDVLIDVAPPVTREIAQHLQQLTGSKTYIVTPIVVLGETIGVLETESQLSHIDTENIELLERLSSQIGVSIVNSRLYTETLNQKKEIESHYQEMNNILSELQMSYSKLESFTSELEISKNKLEEMKGILYHSDKLATIGQVIASITHQFSSPITVITGQSDLLIKELNDRGIEAGKERIEKIKLSVSKLNESVKKLMLSVRQSKPEFRDININTIVNSVSGLWEYELKVAGMRLDKKLDETLPLIEGVPDALEQLLANLISNAKDAMEERKSTITVSTRLFDKDNIELEVTDEGMGIPDNQLDKIFTPFFTTKPAGKGTGLGMVIVMNAVEEHNGRLMVRSELNKGTTFTIILPIKHHKEQSDAV